jgi:RNA polymerase sigma-70 factor (ECF subfamily)
VTILRGGGQPAIGMAVPRRHVAAAPPPDPCRDLARVYALHVDFVFRVVARLGVPASAVPDVVQDVFLVVHRRLPDFDGRASLRAWLAGICRGVAANRRRAVDREGKRLRLLGDTPAVLPDPADRRVDLARVVTDLLDSLDEEQRLALMLTDIEGMTPLEVADALGVSRNTIYSRLRLARAKLRRRLAELDGVDEGREATR